MRIRLLSVEGFFSEPIKECRVGIRKQTRKVCSGKLTVDMADVALVVTAVRTDGALLVYEFDVGSAVADDAVELLALMKTARIQEGKVIEALANNGIPVKSGIIEAV